MLLSPQNRLLCYRTQSAVQSNTEILYLKKPVALGNRLLGLFVLQKDRGRFA